MTQDDALAVLKTGVNVFLTGEPGAGKTHTVNAYVAYLRSCGVEPAITASTGIAATHIGGMTIHSWSGIGIRKFLSEDDLTDLAENTRLVKRLKHAQVLIIDEISMLDASTLTVVDEVCRSLRRNNAPFGGIQVVLVGDFFQLPPVSRDSMVPQFAFMADAWSIANFTVCYLSEQHRQEDPVFLDILTALRAGEVTEEHGETLRARQVAPNSNADVILTKLYSHNADVDRMNAQELAKLPGEQRTFAMRGHGAPPLIEQLKRGCLSPEQLQLKVGARVMFTKNDFEKGFVNGSIGEVISFAIDTKYPMVKLRSGRTIEAEPMDWSVEADGRPLATVSQIPLRLAWAMTVHKSQGMSLDAAYVDLAGAFAYGQGYVALSRVRTLAGLYLGGLNQRALEVDGTVVAADAEFRAQSDDAEASLAAMAPEELLKRQETFIERCGGSVDAGILMRAFAKPKKQAGAGYAETLALIAKGMSIADVAAARGRAPGTIIEHLEELRTRGELPVAAVAHLFVAGDEALAKIHEAFRACEDERLKPIYEQLGGEFAYDVIRLARLLLVK